MFISVSVSQVTPDSDGFGSYNCTATNMMGTDSKEFLLIAAGLFQSFITQKKDDTDFCICSTLPFLYLRKAKGIQPPQPNGHSKALVSKTELLTSYVPTPQQYNHIQNEKSSRFVDKICPCIPCTKMETDIMFVYEMSQSSGSK